MKREERRPLGGLPRTLGAATKRHLWAFIVLWFVAYFSFLSTVHGGFLVDDWWWSATVRNGDWPTLGGSSQFFRPLSSLIFMSLSHFIGLNTWLVRRAPDFHLFNIALLVVSAYAIRTIFLKLCPKSESSWTPTFAGAVFILWPSHAEPVSWISCFSDLLVVALGALSIWSYLNYVLRRKARYAAAAILLMVMALLSKESAIVMPLIAVAIGFALSCRSEMRFGTKELAIQATISCALILAFVVVRAANIHHVVGGYSKDQAHAFLTGILGVRLTTNLADAYLPATRLIVSLWGEHGIAWIRPLVLLIILGLLGVLSRFPRRTEPLSYAKKRLVFGFFLVTVFWLAGIAFWPYLVATVSILARGAPSIRFAALAALALTTYEAFRIIKRNWMAAPDWLTDAKLSYAWVFASALTAAIIENTDVLDVTAFVEQLALMAALLWLIRVTRPTLQPTKQAPSEASLLIGLSLVGASVLAILPSVALPIGWDGQQSRFAYLSSMFAVLFLAYCFNALVRRNILRVGVAVIALPILFVLLEGPVYDWSSAGWISFDVANMIDSTRAGNKTYIVTAPAQFGSALCLLGGLEQVPYVLSGDKTSQVIPIIRVDNMLPNDKIVVSSLGANRYSFRLIAAKGFRLSELSSTPFPHGNSFRQFFDHTTGENIVQIEDRKPWDQVLCVDAKGPHLLQ